MITSKDRDNLIIPGRIKRLSVAEAEEARKELISEGWNPDILFIEPLNRGAAEVIVVPL